MKINKMKQIKLFFISLIACGCSSSKFVEVQTYSPRSLTYAAGMKIQKKTSCTTAILELRYGYDPNYMSDIKRASDNEHYNFSLELTGFHKLSSISFLLFKYPLEDFVLDESNAFAKVENTFGIPLPGRKITFNKSFEYVMDFKSVPNSSGHLQLAFMRSEKNQPSEEYKIGEARISFTKTDKKIVFKS